MGSHCCGFETTVKKGRRRMKEHIFLLLFLLCQLVVMEEALSKKEKEGGNIQKESRAMRNSMEDQVGKVDKQSDKREILMGSKGESEGRGPPRRKKAMEVVVGKVGQEVKMVCPITGNPTPIIEWEKDGEVVDYTWTRVKTNKNYLKVKQTFRDIISNLQFCLQLRGAKLEDTGVFYCR